MSEQTQIRVDVGLTRDRRTIALEKWLESIEEVAGAELFRASDDASFRRYFRVQTDHASFIAMDAPPALENCEPFIRIAGYLNEMGLNAPRVVAKNLDEGFLLLTDLGSTPYLNALHRDPSTAEALYAEALDALIVLQARGVTYQSSLPPYEEERFRMELSIFREWLCDAHLGLTFTDEDENHWQNVCDVLVRNALDQPHVFVHRDFHSRNLMLTEENNPGILDFQDALEGPLTYDLVSLLKDCYITWPEEGVYSRAYNFYERLDASIRQQVDKRLFIRYFDLMGVQRHLKAAGIFARLNHRDGKPGYLADIPRTLCYIVDLAPKYDELGWLVELISKQVLPAVEVST